MRRLSRGGDSKLGCILWLLLLGAFVLICVKAIPVKLQATELYDYMDDQARFAARKTPEELKGIVLRKARDLELPVTSKSIQVEKIGGRIVMRARFTVPLEFPGYTYDWDFDLRVDRQVFLF